MTPKSQDLKSMLAQRSCPMSIINMIRLVLFIIERNQSALFLRKSQVSCLILAFSISLSPTLSREIVQFTIRFPGAGEGAVLGNQSFREFYLPAHMPFNPRERMGV